MNGLDRRDVRALLSDISARTGLDFHDRHVDQLRETIERAMREAQCSSISAFRRTLQSTVGAFDDLVGKLTVGETYFFRDTRQFEFVRDRIFPDLLSRKRSGGSPRLWSAGCSSGEEAYSLAILLQDADPAGEGRVLATDLSRPALRRAREARYREWSLRGEWRAVAMRYLSLEDGVYALDPRIRRRAVFEYLNLSADRYPSLATDTWGLDLIFCRNVLIYFDRQTTARVCRQFYECLVPGGWLVLGASDPLAAAFAGFEVIEAPAGLVYRRPHMAIPAASVPPPRFEAPGRSPTAACEPTALNSSSGESGSTEFKHAGRKQAGATKGGRRSVGAETLHAARAAMEAGDYASAVTLTREYLADGPAAPERPDAVEAGVLHVRALTFQSIEEAEQACSALVRQHRLSQELLYLHAILFIDLGRSAEALEQLRRALFLDRSAAIAHFTQGAVFRRLGRAEEARRAFRNAQRYAAALPADETLPLGDGETAGRLLESAHQQLRLLGETGAGETAAGEAGAVK
ncbi:CheR family methyltransferase [Alienimonas chondri]|uniref:CheR-type methyltransferase domain-containing protein n=1 Tax=Alienimonas chondri TaxID=2681879 RepID=A0ABX1VA79_9PLAN|nr:CheR family methyltransferase [Alienimonas chondri]NNJ25002.1 hypothetical protein [Alienimonas chondri]